MRILFLTAFPPSNIGAGVNYTRQLLDDLSKNNEIHIIYVKGKRDDNYIPSNERIIIKRVYNITKIQKICNCLSQFWLFPLFSAKFNWLLCNKIKQLVKKEIYDIVYCDFSQMFLYGRRIGHHNTIFMAHDVITQRYERKNTLLSLWAEKTEKKILNNTNTSIFTFSNKDSDLLYKLFAVKSTPTSFYFDDIVVNAYPQKIQDYYVMFAMWKRADNYQGLEWFIKSVISKQNAANKKINYKVIGMGLPNRVVHLIEQFDNIEYLGFVSNPYNIIANAKALIAPLFKGAGVKVKVLDALVCGTPVIGTDVAFEGIEIDEKYSAFIIECNSYREFLQATDNVKISIEKRIEMKQEMLRRMSQKTIKNYLKSIETQSCPFLKTRSC